MLVGTPTSVGVSSAVVSTASSVGDTISSRQDVVRLIDRICEYYNRCEPSSPVPFLLQRARSMVNMNYMEIVKCMTPDALSQAELITGQFSASEEPTE